METIETGIEHTTHIVRREPDVPRPRSSAEIAQRYLTFFRERDHLEIPGAPLVMEDGTTSFVIAGMQPLLPYLRGAVPPPAPRLTDIQRCLRTDDAGAVGTNGRKLTSFHMLGNWSIGDYGRREAIGLALALLDELGFDHSRLWVTTFGGDEAHGLQPDTLAVQEWRRAGMPEDRIVPLGMDDNFWSTGGPGPCGPDTELFMDRGASVGCGDPECKPGCACERFLEVWNLVFIEFEQHDDGTYTPLPLRSVDTGMGLERMAAVLQGVLTVFETDLFMPAWERLASLAPIGVAGGGAVETKARRVIVDHVRAALFAYLAGVQPDRAGRGSVLRQLIRRAARQGRVLGLDQPFLGALVGPLVAAHGALLTPQERERASSLAEVLTQEERRFARVLTAGLRALERIEPRDDGLVPGEELFVLHAERGFPADLAAEVLAERGLRVDWSSYERATEAHREVSRVSADRRFRDA
jgi:alanyl-tRNA synthetase